MPKLKLKVNSGMSCGESSARKCSKPKLIKAPLRTLFNDPLNDKSQVTEVHTNLLQKAGTDEQVSKYFQTKEKEDATEQDQTFQDFLPKKPKVRHKSRSNKLVTKQIKNVKAGADREDLGKYTAAFEKECSTTGVDVNPEHLQMAVALSLSMHRHKPETSPKIISDSAPSEEEKIKKIRKTLLEYGFVVPTCSSFNKSERIKYSLLYTRTAEERRQMLSTFVSSVLLDNQIVKAVHSNIKTQPTSLVLKQIWSPESIVFSKASLPYASMCEDLSIYYINDLIFPSYSEPGCLLKDWSKIAGRDCSSDIIHVNVDYRETQLYKKDLDALLSSTNVEIHRKLNNYCSSPQQDMEKTVDKSDASHEMAANVSGLQNKNNDSYPHHHSPDLFEEEPYDVEAPMVNVHQLTDDVSNDSLPDVFVSQMTADVNLDSPDVDCSIDLTGGSIKVASAFSNEPIVIEETDEEDDLLDCSQNKPSYIGNNTSAMFDKSEVTTENEIKIHGIDDSPCNGGLEVESAANEIMKSHPNSFSESDGNEHSNSGNKLSVSFTEMDDNGIVHFTSYADNDDAISVCEKICRSQADGKEDSNKSVNTSNSDEQRQDVTLSCKNKQNIHNLSESIFTDDEGAESGVDGPVSSTDKPNSLNNEECTLAPQSEDVDKVDLTQSSNELDEINYVDQLMDLNSPTPQVESPRKLFNDDDNVFEISDEEFMYSVNATTNLLQEHENSDDISKENILASDDIKTHHVPNDFDLYGSSIFDQIPSCLASKIYDTTLRDTTRQKASTDMPGCSNQNTPKRTDTPSFNKYNISTNGTNKNASELNEIGTPVNDKFILKTNNVTPMQDYSKMDTPRVHKELSKYGMKPLKRKRAVQILEHIYNQTHPLVNFENHTKRIKMSGCFQNNTSSPIKHPLNEMSPEKAFGADANLENRKDVTDDLYRIDKSSVAIRQMDCDQEELYFQPREKSKIFSCPVPLHVAFHNYISMRSGLQRAILAYLPINIDTVHKGLVADGYRYKPKDLFQFMDKKCITIKTADKNGCRQKKKR